MISALLYFIYGTVNLAYYLAHGNGKKYVRLFSAFVLYTPAVLLAFGIFEVPDFWFNIVGLLSVLDVIVDWHGKTKRGK